jgi:threonine dehydrogenase-like Zn-dependent dehydrogenase
LTPKALVTHQFPVAKVKEAMELVKDTPAAVCKVLLRFD